MIDIRRRSFILGAAAVLVAPERTFHFMPKRTLFEMRGDIFIIDDLHYIDCRCIEELMEDWIECVRQLPTRFQWLDSITIHTVATSR